MKKGTRILKRYLATFLVVLMSINTFAAVVGDNDGAAFITKAEFDSMKNDFQSQLDRYNSSIDNKIDGAIASYLSGIKIAKRTPLRLLVDDYREIFWLHDFSLEAVEKTMTAKGTGSATARGTLQPRYDNLLGIFFVMYNRGLHLNFSAWANFAGMAGFLNFTTPGDGTGALRVNTNSSNGPIEKNCSPPLLSIRVDKNDVMTGSPLNYLWGIFYPNQRFGEPYYNEIGFWGDAANFNWTDRSTYYVKPVPADEVPADTVLALTINTQVSEILTKFKLANTEFFPIHRSDYSNRELMQNTDDNHSNTMNYPYSVYYSRSSQQVTFDQKKIRGMMIGAKTDFKVPILKNVQNGGRLGQLRTDVPWPDWSQWNSSPVDLELKPGRSAIFVGQSLTSSTSYYTTHPLEVPSGVENKFSIKFPVWTTFPVENVKSPFVSYKGENLSVCAGVPITEPLTESGQIEVAMKCTKGYDDVTKTVAPNNVNAKVKFKKTNFLTNNTDYYTGTINDSNDYITFDGNITHDLTNIKFILDVKKDEQVWMNIDPITIGQHIKINEMAVTFIAS